MSGWGWTKVTLVWVNQLARLNVHTHTHTLLVMFKTTKISKKNRPSALLPYNGIFRKYPYYRAEEKEDWLKINI